MSMPVRRRRHADDITDAVNHAVRLADVDQRQYIWLGLMVTGDVATHVKGEFSPANFCYAVT